jgi:histidine triad (HIT) family protein
MEDIFCKIARGETDTEFLLEDDDMVVFADIKPKAPVHYLVVPRKHIATINDAMKDDATLLGDMLLRAQEAARKLGIVDGYKLIFNVGEKGGQVIPHIHLHLLGGWDTNKN